MTIDNELLIPATPELLEGWCGPIVVLDHEGWCEVPMEAALYGLRGFAVTCWCHLNGVPCERLDIVDLAHVRLDLSRAEVRDRVARVIIRQSGPRLASQGGSNVLFCPNRPSSVRGFTSVPHPDGSGPGVIPALAALDPHDDTRLPDGSRRVDALALAAVWRAVAGEVTHG